MSTQFSRHSIFPFKIYTEFTEGMLDRLDQGKHTVAWFVGDCNHTVRFKDFDIRRAIQFAQGFSSKGEYCYVAMCLVDAI